MSDAAAQLIDAFTALPMPERRAVLVELARISDDDAGPLTDEELCFVGEEAFARYDQEEQNRDTTDAG